MTQICLEQGLMQPAVFELVVRALPPQRNFLVAAGLEQALQFLASLSFTEAEFAWLRDQGGFSAQMLDCARTLRFEGDVDAMPEGTVFFADEPILRVTAPWPMAQLVEHRLRSLIHFETMIASTASRLVIAARGGPVADLGMRRTHEGEAALLAARAAYLAGAAGTTLPDAARRFGIPVIDTMAANAAAVVGEDGLPAEHDEQPPGVDAFYVTRHDLDTIGARNVMRHFGRDGRIECDVVGPQAGPCARDALLQPCMRAGVRVGPTRTLQESRAYHARQIARLPESLRTLEPARSPMRVVHAAVR